MLYKLLRPYYSLSHWFRFQRQIYSIPRKDRPAFWTMQTQLTIAKAFMQYEFGKKIFGGFQSQRNPKEFNGLASIFE